MGMDPGRGTGGGGILGSAPASSGWHWEKDLQGLIRNWELNWELWPASPGQDQWQEHPVSRDRDQEQGWEWGQGKGLGPGIWERDREREWEYGNGTRNKEMEIWEWERDWEYKNRNRTGNMQQERQPDKEYWTGTRNKTEKGIQTGMGTGWDRE